MDRWYPFGQLFLARLREFYREPVAVFWVYGFPLFLAIALGVAFAGGQPLGAGSSTQDTPPVAIQGGGDEAVALQKELEGNGVPAQLFGPEECRARLRGGKIALYIIPSPQGYEYHFDPTRPDGLIARYRIDDLVQRWKTGSSAWHTTDHPVHEPGDRYIDFLIPGLMGFNLMGGGLWGVGFVIVDLRVRKLLKRFLATPMRRSDFLLSVLASRLLFLFPETLVLLLVGCLGFRVPINGNLLTLILVIVLGGAAFSGIGLLLACRTQKTETVSGLINLLTLPMWMLSGTFFSARRFPGAMQPFIQALPLTQVNDALRQVMLEGASLAAVGWRLAILGAWAGASFFLALKWFRWR
jgi:ABC-2 type transport system permease protein